MKNSHEVYGFDLFDSDGDYYLLAHDKETLMANIEWAKRYRAENSECGILLGYFTKGFNAEILTDCEVAA